MRRIACFVYFYMLGCRCPFGESNLQSIVSFPSVKWVLCDPYLSWFPHIPLGWKSSEAPIPYPGHHFHWALLHEMHPKLLEIAMWWLWSLTLEIKYLVPLLSSLYLLEAKKKLMEKGRGRSLPTKPRNNIVAKGTWRASLTNAEGRGDNRWTWCGKQAASVQTPS